MRLLHTSDWHLGRQFHGVSLLADQANALAQLVDIVKQQQVDAVLIAGDVYDRAVPPAEAVALLDATLNTLVCELNVQVIIISGNHDSAQRLGFASQSLRQSGLYLITSLAQLCQPVVLTKRDISVTIWGIAYSDTESVRHFARQYPNNSFIAPTLTTSENQPNMQPKANSKRNKLTASAAQLDLWGKTEPTCDSTTEHSQVAGTENVSIDNQQQAYDYLIKKITPHLQVKQDKTFNLLMAHCFLAGANVSDSERPLSVGGSEQVNSHSFSKFDYVALGHLHAPQHRGNEHIRYSGSLLKYSFSEVGHTKGVTLFEFTDKGLSHIHQYPIKPKRDMRVVEGYMADILAQTTDHNEDYVLVRLLDEHAIIDAMGKLRACYPNILHLEKVGISQAHALHASQKTGLETLNRAPLALFNEFFEQMTTKPLTEQQKQQLTRALADVQAEP